MCVISFRHFRIRIFKKRTFQNKATTYDSAPKTTDLQKQIIVVGDPEYNQIEALNKIKKVSKVNSPDLKNYIHFEHTKKPENNGIYLKIVRITSRVM